MRDFQVEPGPKVTNVQLLLAYVADLELEVGRLRTQSRFIRHESRRTLKGIQSLCKRDGGTGEPSPVLVEIEQAAAQLRGMLVDMHEVPGYHPAHDQVIDIAIRPLAEQVFRWQQRLAGATDVALRLELETESVEWFPGRLRHVLDILIADAFKHRDPAKAESWVRVWVRENADGYELQVEKNGVGLPPDERALVFELLFRASPARTTGRGVGPAIVKMLVEQSGGTLTVSSVAGEGTTFVATLPRYDVDDYLN